jgi:tripartite-type tricarboxylate transporter receptor subunit TctC
VVARIIADKVTPGWNQNFVFDNRGGGGGVIGAAIVAKAAPDGYTILLHTAAYSSMSFFYKNLPYDPVRDLTPITLIAKNVGYALIVNPRLPVKTVKDLLALAEASPGKLNFGSPGVGSVGHLAAELFVYMAKIKMTHVPYTGIPAMMTDIIGGQIDLGFPAAPSAMALITAGRVQVLGITGEKRWEKLPQVPTLDEAGVKGYKFLSWYGLWFPAGTPAVYVQRVRNDVAAAVKDPTVRKRLDEQGLDGVGSTPQELARVVNEEMAINKELTARIGIVPQ